VGFPDGTLAGREVAAYVISRAAGWDVVPPTVMRDGPFGPGMCQLWIDHDTDVDLIALSRRTDHAGLRDMAVFDAVVNNADRKIGHLLPVTDGHLYGCDHGVCFAEDYKLRTVLWQWRGKTLPRRSLEALRRLNAQLNEDGLEAELSSLLTASEISATRIRVETLLKHRVHPLPALRLARHPLASGLDDLFQGVSGRRRAVIAWTGWLVASLCQMAAVRARIFCSTRAVTPATVCPAVLFEVELALEGVVH